MSDWTNELFLVGGEKILPSQSSLNDDNIIDEMLEGIEAKSSFSSNISPQVYTEPEFTEKKSVLSLIKSVEKSFGFARSLSSEIKYYNSEIYNQFHIE